MISNLRHTPLQTKHSIKTDQCSNSILTDTRNSSHDVKSLHPTSTSPTSGPKELLPALPRYRANATPLIEITRCVTSDRDDTSITMSDFNLDAILQEFNVGNAAPVAAMPVDESVTRVRE